MGAKGEAKLVPCPKTPQLRDALRGSPKGGEKEDLGFSLLSRAGSQAGMRSATIPGSQRGSCCCSGPAATSALAGGGVRGAGLAPRPRARRPRDVTAHARRAPRAAAAGQAGGAGEAPGLARTRGGPSAPRWAGRGCCARNSPTCPAVFHAGACALHTGRVCIPTAQPRCAAAPRSSPRRSPELPAAWARRDPLPHAAMCAHWLRAHACARARGHVWGSGRLWGAPWGRGWWAG